MKALEQLTHMLAGRDREFATMVQQQNKAFKWAWGGSLAAIVIVLVIAIIAMTR
jgi:hypothetical protein